MKKITIIGAGNSGLAMAAHLSSCGENVALWNRSKEGIAKLKKTRTIYSYGAIEGEFKIDLVTNDIKEALDGADLILITTPANSHRDLAELIAKNIRKEALIVLNPGRTFGALEFREIFKRHNNEIRPTIAETQTIIYTCRRTGDDSVNVISLKNGVLLSTFDSSRNNEVIKSLPECIQKYFVPAESMVQTSIGNVGMILHCAPLLLNTGWTENPNFNYKYYHDGITESIAAFLEKIDRERVEVSKLLGLKIESTEEWFKRAYDVQGSNLYECIQNTKAYEMIGAPSTLNHRYIFEDIPCGLVPLESAGKSLGLSMTNTGIVIDLASALLDRDFRKEGRDLRNIFYDRDIDFSTFFVGVILNEQDIS